MSDTDQPVRPTRAEVRAFLNRLPSKKRRALRRDAALTDHPASLLTLLGLVQLIFAPLGVAALFEEVIGTIRTAFVVLPVVVVSIFILLWLMRLAGEFVLADHLAKICPRGRFDICPVCEATTPGQDRCADCGFLLWFASHPA